MFDHIIAVIGSLILLGLSGIIIFISLYGETHTREISILESYYGTGGISTGTGYTLSPPYSKAPEFLRYDRKSNILSFVVTSQTGKVLEYSSAELSKSSYDEIHPVYMSRDQVIATAKKDGTSLLLKGTSAFLIEKALFSENSVLAKSGSGWMLA